MGSFADLTIGDVTKALGRYRPVAITVAIILLVVAVSPGPRRLAAGNLAGLPGPVQVAPTGAAVAGAPVTEDVALTTSSSAPSSFDSSSSSSSSFSPPSSSSNSFGSSDSSSSFGDDDSSSSFGSPDSSPPSDSFGTPDDSSSSPGSSSSSSFSEPLRIVASAWASRTAGTPLGGTGVPEGTLPVGKRIGQQDKRSFIRLAGSETVLNLSEDTATSRGTTGTVVIAACQITDAGWKEATNITFEQAPKFDDKSCVVGVRSSPGAWTFDLSLFSTISDDRGFALLPMGDSVDYQVNYKRS